MLTYKEYHIERFERGPKRWIARISRADGRKLRVIMPASEHSFLDTKPSATAEEAEELAKQGIDFGGMVRTVGKVSSGASADDLFSFETYHGRPRWRAPFPIVTSGSLILRPGGIWCRCTFLRRRDSTQLALGRLLR